MTRWSTPVRYAEVDQQGVVFNAHYLTYCDEAMATYFAERDLRDVAERVQLVSSTLTWHSPVRWAETVDVDVRCESIGTTSFAMHFEITVDDRQCCAVGTTYVLVEAGRAQPIPDDLRQRLS